MNIREHRSSDTAALITCLIQLQDAERQFLPTLLAGRDIAGALLQEMLDLCHARAGKIFVVEAEEQVAGFVAVQAKVPMTEIDEESYEYGYISDLVVLDTFRGRGFGRALLAAAEEYVRTQGITRLRLSVLAQNSVARQLYHRLGFVEWEVILEKILD